MRRFIFSIILTGSFLTSTAMHVTGGEIIYEYTGIGGASGRQYRITLMLFRDNTGGGAILPPEVVIAVFNNNTNTLLPYRIVQQNSEETVPVFPLPNCITNEPTLDYSVGYYSFTISLPVNTLGYTI